MNEQKLILRNCCTRLYKLTVGQKICTYKLLVLIATLSISFFKEVFNLTTPTFTGKDLENQLLLT